MTEAGQNRRRHDSDALVGVGVLHSAIVFDRLATMEDTLGHLWEEGRCDKDIFDPAPLQSTDERIWFGLDTPKRVQKFKLPDLGSRDDNRGWTKSNDTHDVKALAWQKRIEQERKRKRENEYILLSWKIYKSKNYDIC